MCFFLFFIAPGHSCFVGNKKVQCMFCKSTMGITCWMPNKLRKHLLDLYKEHQNKSASFFENYYKTHFLKSSQFFQNNFKSLTKNDPAVLLSLDVAHVLMKDRKPFTEAESTIKKCLIKAAERLHGGSKAVDRVKKSSASDTTMARRCTLLKI